MTNGVNYFSMHRQILDQQHQVELAIKSNAGVGKKKVEALEKLADIEEGAKAFEAYFIQTLLKEMRKGLSSNEESGVGLGKDMYESLFDEAIAQKISEVGGIGLSKMLSEKLSRSLKFSEDSGDQSVDPKVFHTIRR